MVRRRSTVRFRKGALAHKPRRRHLTCVNTVGRRIRVLRLATAETGSLRLAVPNTCPRLSRILLWRQRAYPSPWGVWGFALLPIVDALVGDQIAVVESHQSNLPRRSSAATSRSRRASRASSGRSAVIKSLLPPRGSASQ
jgi:hypothetical protein